MCCGAALLLGLGLLIDETRSVALGGGFGVTWGVLEALGVSYLIAYLVMRLSTPLRMVVTRALLGLHLGLTLAIPWYRNFVMRSAHGSPFSALSWSVMAIGNGRRGVADAATGEVRALFG